MPVVSGFALRRVPGLGTQEGVSEAPEPGRNEKEILVKIRASKQDERPLSVVVIGASGDLARRKIIPALFALYSQGQLPKDFHVFGLARTPMDHQAFRERLSEHLTCRYTPGESCASAMSGFLDRCHYCAGQYGDVNAYLDLYQLMQSVQGTRANKIFYMAIPPDVFADVGRALGDAGLVECGSAEPWSRVVIEKPFGLDRASSDRLVEEMRAVFSEEATFRIDHYLGKEVVQNLMVLRFANSIFEPLWNCRYVSGVRITWREPIGVGQRGGYFDNFGIIRDVMQNHLLQILALLTMEQPQRFDAGAIRDQKVRLLRCVSAPTTRDAVVGQYVGVSGVSEHRSYLEEPGVPEGSRTPTYASVLLRIANPRWRGVPFLIEAGKALDRHINEVRVCFHPPERQFWRAVPGGLTPNELIIRIQPNEAIQLSITNKVPGLELALRPTTLNLYYQDAYQTLIPDAYECLLLDVVEGDRSLFIREDELRAAWDVFTPLLHELERDAVRPEPYAFGTEGPEGRRRLELGMSDAIGEES